MHPDELQERVIVLTGGTSGIGRVAAKRLARNGASVVVVGRNRKRGTQLAASSASFNGEITFLQADLADQATVRTLASEISETVDHLDVLVHNAGLSTTERQETADGIELTMAVNHLAPYLLTHELLDCLMANIPSRIVVTASGIHRRGNFSVGDIQFEDGYNGLQAYARSKLANVAFSLELADRLEKEITINCFHPGFIPSTKLFREAAPWTRTVMRVLGIIPLLGASESKGANRIIHLVVDPKFNIQTGQYVEGDTIVQPAAHARDPVFREQLWVQSAALVGVDPEWP